MEGDIRPPYDKTASSLQGNPNSYHAKTNTLETNSFRTPEQVAEKEGGLNFADSSTQHDARGTGDQPKNNLIQKLRSFKVTKKEWMVSAAVIIVCGSIVGYVLNHTGPKPVVSANNPKPAVKKEAPKPTTVPSTLTGLPVDPTVNNRPVTGVMIENSLDARPQSGLSEAGVVFEAIAEGGITRFLALYQDTAPADIGPVRSARPYYIQWALGFDAAYAHVGGSPQALRDIKTLGVKDLDQFYNAGAYRRITTRYAPHNVYTTMANLNQLETAKGYNTSTYTGFVRKKATPLKTPTAAKIDINMSGSLYNVHYDYNPATNTYNRVMGGAAHIDANGNRQISPNVVVVMVVPYGIAADGHHSEYRTIGSGQVFVYQDGGVTIGTWTKANERSQITFTDANNKPILLNPGQTWLSAVGSASKVTASP